MPSYGRDDVGIRCEDMSSGFSPLITPSSGLNSRVSDWPTAV
jgi:hypothetical protein